MIRGNDKRLHWLGARNEVNKDITTVCSINASVHAIKSNAYALPRCDGHFSINLPNARTRPFPTDQRHAYTSHKQLEREQALNDCACCPYHACQQGATWPWRQSRDDRPVIKVSNISLITNRSTQGAGCILTSPALAILFLVFCPNFAILSAFVLPASV